MAQEIRNRMGEFLLSGQILSEDQEEFVDGDGQAPGEGSPQSGDSLQTVESTIRRTTRALEGAGALPPADNHRATYRPEEPYGAEEPVSAEADFTADKTPEQKSGKGFGKKTERSFWDRDDMDDDPEPEEGEDELKSPETGKVVKESGPSPYAGMPKEQLMVLLQKAGQARSVWSGNKADPYYPTYLKALKAQKEIQQALRLHREPTAHDPSLNPALGRRTANSTWEATSLDPKILVRKMVERGFTDAQIREVMKTQFSPMQKKNSVN